MYDSYHGSRLTRLNRSGRGAIAVHLRTAGYLTMYVDVALRQPSVMSDAIPVGGKQVAV